jgi:hypothetical protein
MIYFSCLLKWIFQKKRSVFFVLSYVFNVAHHKVENILSEWIKDVYNIDDFYVMSSGGFSEG